MRSALNAGKKIISITADVRSFYHELNPGFMIDQDFIKGVLNLEFSAEQSKINRLFISALQAWAAVTPLKKGLPVGLPASAVVANMALVELDRFIEQQVAPLYYGRYVDDILLVMENGARFRSVPETWEWLFSRSDGKLGWGNEGKKDIVFRTSYFERNESKSKICFSNSKSKIFMLAGEPGKTLVDAIDHQIHERASEWRAMPRLPRFSGYVGTDLLAVTQSDGETADSLRKADALTMRRAGFAIKLRDLEAYERDLPPDAWREHRQTFFRSFIQHVLVLPQFFDLAVYLPRVICLANSCEEFKCLREIMDALVRVIDNIDKCCKISINSCDESNEPSSEYVLSMFKNYIKSMIRDALISSFPSILSVNGRKAWRDFIESADFDRRIKEIIIGNLAIRDIQRAHRKLFSFDLAYMPFRFIGMPNDLVYQNGIPAKKSVIMYNNSIDMFPKVVIDGVAKLAEWLKFRELPHGLLFATRPFNIPELFIISREGNNETGLEFIRNVVLAIRGFALNENMPHFDSSGILRIPDGKVDKCNIAVSSWKTNLDSWTAAATKMPDPDIDRYVRINKLLDSVISQPQQCRYFIMPELSLPARWFIRIARKLHGRGISLIAGVEYLHAGKSRVRNQVWASLSHVGLGFSSFIIYRQDKQHPALHEEIELNRLAGLQMVPEVFWGNNVLWKKGVPPIIQHGDFRFSILICSELTNISYRSYLRGRVDALFVPEWNQDTETFNALVESAALDMHAYIIQCNDRQYGDSRIRAPFKDSWKRDVLRVKGGVTDYCVIGTIDVQLLRKFQSSHRSLTKPFKPVPDGFEIARERKALPLSGIE